MATKGYAMQSMTHMDSMCSMKPMAHLHPNPLDHQIIANEYTRT